MSYPGAVLAAGLVLLWLGAEGFIKGGSGVASKAGISPVIVGLTFGAVATSLPEITVSWMASFAGAGPVALGNAVGSNIANTGLALGLGALIFPLAAEKEILRYDYWYLLAAALLLLFFTLDMTIQPVEGLVLVAGFCIYILHIIKRHRMESPPAFRGGGPIVIQVVFFIFGSAALIGGGRLAVNGALSLAENLNISPAVVGLSIVALGTSLPEIAVLVAGACRRSAGISLGTVIGSNIFNIFLVAGGAAIIRPILVLRTEALFHAPALLLFTLILLPVMLTSRKISRTEGAFLLFIYVGYMAALLGLFS